MQPTNLYVEKLHRELISAAFQLNEAVQFDMTPASIMSFKSKLAQVNELTAFLFNSIRSTDTFWGDADMRYVTDTPK